MDRIDIRLHGQERMTLRTETTMTR